MPLKFGSEGEFRAWEAHRDRLAGKTPKPNPPPAAKTAPRAPAAPRKRPRTRKRRSAAAGLSLARILGGLIPTPKRRRGRGRKPSYKIGWL